MLRRAFASKSRRTKMTINFARHSTANAKAGVDKIIETLIFCFAVIGAFVVGAVISQLLLWQPRNWPFDLAPSDRQNEAPGGYRSPLLRPYSERSEPLEKVIFRRFWRPFRRRGKTLRARESRSPRRYAISKKFLHAPSRRAESPAGLVNLVDSRRFFGKCRCLEVISDRFHRESRRRPLSDSEFETAPAREYP